jgi:hypothetical protein
MESSGPLNMNALVICNRDRGDEGRHADAAFKALFPAAPNDTGLDGKWGMANVMTGNI